MRITGDLIREIREKLLPGMRKLEVAGATLERAFEIYGELVPEDDVEVWCNDCRVRVKRYFERLAK